MTTYSNAPSEPRVNLRHEHKYRPVHAGVFHIMTRVTAPTVRDPESERTPLDLAFVVDRSGSMGGGPFELARAAVEHALGLLDARDSVSLTIYDTEIDTLLTQRALDREARGKAVHRLRAVGPRGSTDLAGGWLSGCNQLAPIADGTRVMRKPSASPVCRAVLLTDGLANVGMTDPAEIASHARELAARGISTTTIGLGPQYDELLLGAMADAGGGRFHHVEDHRALVDVFAGELGEMLLMAMRGVTISLRVPSGWRVRLLNDLPLEVTDGWLTLPLGDLYSNQERELVWAVELPFSEPGRVEQIDVCVRWRGTDGIDTREYAFTHAVEAREHVGPADRQVQDHLATQLLAKGRAEALRLNRAGDYRAARQVAYDHAAMMPPSPSGHAAAMELRDEVAPTFSQAASPAAMKQSYARSRNLQRSQRDYTKKP